ncbi:MAG: acetate--CoA ligase family protein [Ignavibacteriaceae bacterium]|nr:acetate--CoA ligase family protein [Ignavibacteriaceae bacterium]
MKEFFYPTSICIAGASSKERSIGYELINTILKYGYTGKILPVNPKADEILGVKCYPRVEDINEKIDLAFIVVPKAFVPETIDSLLAKNVKALVLITAGFKETGEAGAAQERAIVEKVKKSGARLVGPNCMGLINTHKDIKLNATFVAEKPAHGGLAFLSQSGALGAAVINQLRESYYTFGHFVSVGNKADINENDMIEYWQRDDNISAVAMYLESFEDGGGFINLLLQNKIRKPLIIVKAGRSEGGMKAASSHTGALAASDVIVDAVLDQFGVIRAETISDMFNTASGYEHFPLPKGNRVAVLTNAGGPAILCVDALYANGLCLAELTDNTKQLLREFVHPEGSVNNPIDLLPGGSAEQYKKATELLAADENTDAVVSIFVEPVMVPPAPVIEGVYSIHSPKPIVQAVMPLPEFWSTYYNKPEAPKPLYRTPEAPGIVLANLLKIGSAKQSVRIAPAISKYKLASVGYIGSEETETLLKSYNLPVVESVLLSDAEIESRAENISFPVVLKASAEGLVHKTEFNAVRLGINNSKELIAAVDDIRAGLKVKGITAHSWLIQKHVKIKYELLLGGYRDKTFGPVIMFGSGGKYVEALNDTTLRSARLSDEDILNMITGTKGGRIVLGVRGENGVKADMLASLIKNAAQMLLDNEDILEFDFNPLAVDENSELVVLDARVRMGK